jgi:hypothetical protein
MPTLPNVKQYMGEELDLALISDKCFEILGKQPFRWQSYFFRVCIDYIMW